jgi:HAD superfamily hydrolase (TIGR01549 family)
VLPIFDLDGTLIDSDDALLSPFVTLGIAREDVAFGHPLADECERLGITVADYLAAYDVTEAQPYPGVDALLARLGRWAVCSNKDRGTARAELARLGWAPEVARFTDDFDGPKRLGPVIAALGVDVAEIVYVGDTEHDHRCAAEAGVPFALARWNPRARRHEALADVVLDRPSDLLDLLGPAR